jgi:hypothetical protein
MVSFFGLIVHLDPLTTLVVFCLLVFALIMFEHALEKIEHHAEEAKFGELVKKLYKEMMVMGFIGFFIFILFNAFTLEHDENYLAFEFAHITIFFIAIILVFRTIFVVISSNRATAGFWRAHNQKCSALLERYNAVRETCWTVESVMFKYFPIWSGLYTDIEYKIMEDFFHSDFNLSRYEFSFVDYLTMSNKLYAIDKVELSYASWFVVIVLAVMNYARIMLTSRYSCRNHSTDDHYDDPVTTYEHVTRALSAGDDGADFVVSERCANYNTYYFMVSGSILMLFGLFNCYITWRSKVKLLQIAGNDDSDDYEDILTDVMTREQDTFLMLALKHEYNDNKNKNKSMNKNLITASSTRHITEEIESWHVVSLRKVIEEQKKHNEELKRHRQEALKARFTDMLRCLRLEQCRIMATSKNDASKLRLQTLVRLTEKRRALSTRSLSSVAPPPTKPTRRFSLTTTPLGALQESPGSPGPAARSRKDAPPSLPAHTGGKGVSTLKPQSSSRSMLEGGAQQQQSEEQQQSEGVWEEHPLMYELDSIFIFESRQTYNFLLEIFQMLCALYLSLYLTNFLFIALETKQATWNMMFSLGSIVVLLVIMSFTQFHSNVLCSVTSLQNGATEWICEQDEIKNKTLPKLREELINIIDKDNFVQEIGDLYSLVNENGDDGIDIKKFHNLLFTLNIHLNDEEVQCLFRVLNTSGT